MNRSVLWIALGLLLVTPARSAELANPPKWARISASSTDSPEEFGGYTQLWAVSDLHGHRQTLEDLLVHAALAKRDGHGVVRWTAERALLIVLGDVIDLNDKESKNTEEIDESAEMLIELSRLQFEAQALKSRVVLTLGNHELEVLAFPNPEEPGHKMEKGFLKSMARVIGVKKSELTPELLQKSQPWKVMESMNLGVILGDSIWVHSGDFVDQAPLNQVILKMEDDARAGYQAFFLSGASAISGHDWYSPRQKVRKKQLEASEWRTLVVGHERKILKDSAVTNEIAMNKKLWLLKLDAGLKRGAAGRILHCAISKMKTASSASGLGFSKQGQPVCESISSEGRTKPLPVAD